jgi:hypothetical protein
LPAQQYAQVLTRLRPVQSGRSLSVSSSDIRSCTLAHIYSHPLMLWLPLCAGAGQRGDSGLDRAGSTQDPANGFRRISIPRTLLNNVGYPEMHGREGRHDRSRPYLSLAARILIGALIGVFLGLLEIWSFEFDLAHLLAAIAAGAKSRTDMPSASMVESPLSTAVAPKATPNGIGASNTGTIAFAPATNAAAGDAVFGSSSIVPGYHLRCSQVGFDPGPFRSVP